MYFIARISGVSDENGERWLEARADKEKIFRFKAPKTVTLELGDAISFTKDLVGNPTLVEVFKRAGGATIHVRKEDVRDLSDRRIVGEVKFARSGTSIRLYASGQVEVDSPQPGSSGRWGTSGFDELDHFAEYANSVAEHWLSEDFSSAGSREDRAAIIEWINGTALPALRAARARFQR
jgi:hypothetical protein